MVGTILIENQCDNYSINFASRLKIEIESLNHSDLLQK